MNNHPGHFSPRKGSILEGSEVRTIVINYAKKNDLVDADNKKWVDGEESSPRVFQCSSSEYVEGGWEGGVQEITAF